MKPERYTVYEASKRNPQYLVFEEDGTEDGRLVADFHKNKAEAEAYAAWLNRENSK